MADALQKSSLLVAFPRGNARGLANLGEDHDDDDDADADADIGHLRTTFGFFLCTNHAHGSSRASCGEAGGRQTSRLDHFESFG